MNEDGAGTSNYTRLTLMALKMGQTCAQEGVQVATTSREARATSP